MAKDKWNAAILGLLKEETSRRDRLRRFAAQISDMERVFRVVCVQHASELKNRDPVLRGDVDRLVEEALSDRDRLIDRILTNADADFSRRQILDHIALLEGYATTGTCELQKRIKSCLDVLKENEDPIVHDAALEAVSTIPWIN